jgi:hypothetical protein
MRAGCWILSLTLACMHGLSPSIEPRSSFICHTVSSTSFPFDPCSRSPSSCIKRDAPYAPVPSLTFVPVSPFFHILLKALLQCPECQHRLLLPFPCVSTVVLCPDIVLASSSSTLAFVFTRYSGMLTAPPLLDLLGAGPHETLTADIDYPFSTARHQPPILRRRAVLAI